MLACGSAAPCDGNVDKSHLLTLHRCSGLLLQYRLLPLSAANPGRSSKAEAETRLQNTLSAPFADPWRAPLEQAPAPRPSKAGGEAFSKYRLCRVFFLVQLPLASTGTNLIGVWQFAVADGRHATPTCKSGGEQCSTNTPLHSRPSPHSIPSQNTFVLLRQVGYFFLLQSTESLAEQPTAPGTLRLAIKKS